ncbi:hypothetical protein [Rhodococcus qingshengii]|uniref:hypothetical protein n=1 Tax=Rhodococcus qingshengii TaxID=334542 RepID=UPI00195678CB|nr:hypothetical protein [Rhodococcus qingshengii]QXC45211.1 hypothetical protein KSE96_11925 [Rhodococcus qingshengii]
MTDRFRLLARGRRRWRELHAVHDFTDAPEKLAILEEACRTADVAKRLQAIVDAADEIRVRGSQGQPVATPELQELRQCRAQMAQLLKALSCPDDEDTLTRSELGRIGAAARWEKS